MIFWPPTRLWNHLIVTDPGLVRLKMAARPTLAFVLAIAVLALLAHLAGRPPTEIALGGLLAMTGPLLLREPDPRRRQITLLLLPIPAALAFVAGVALLPWPHVGKLAFLAVVFVAVLFQTHSPRAGAFGFIGFLAMFLAMFLHSTPESAITQLLSMAVAVAVVWLVCFRLMPERPAWALRHMLSTLLRRAEAVLADAERTHASGLPADHARLSRHLLRLNEAALAAEDLLGRLDAGGLGTLRRRLVDLELALSRVVGLFSASPDPSLRDRARIRLLRTRLRQGRWARHRLRGRRPAPPSRNTSPLGRAVIELDRVAASIAGTVAAASAAPPKLAPLPPGSLDWRMALRAGAASGLAIIGGSMLSPDRWFWAVITTFVVFIGTRSRGDTIQKLAERMAGTVAGVAAGLGVADLLHGHLALELIALVVCMFVAFYYFVVAYAVSMFCITIMLGVLYSSAGAAPEPLLLLRMDETAVGAAAGLIVALLVLPRRTADDVRTQGLAALAALSEVIRLSIQRLSGGAVEPAEAPVDAMRRLDAALRDLRTAARPLAMRRWLIPGGQVSRATPALLACAHWARLLAARSEHVCLPPASREALLDQARRLEARVAALAAAPAARRGPPDPMAPALPTATLATATPGQAAVAAALDNLDRAVGLLSERLASGTLDAFVYPA